MKPINKEELKLAEEGEIVVYDPSLEIKKIEGAENVERLNTEKIPNRKFDVSEDERDCIEPYKTTNQKTHSGAEVYVIRGTKWIVPRDFATNNANELPIYPDFEVLKEKIYENKGILSEILKSMRWHDVSKGELLRWINKLGLEKEMLFARDGMIDMAESTLKRSLEIDDIDTAKFVLKTAGKNRGWTERMEDDSENAKNVYQFINVINGSDDKNFEKMEERELVKYLEDQVNAKA